MRLRALRSLACCGSSIAGLYGVHVNTALLVVLTASLLVLGIKRRGLVCEGVLKLIIAAADEQGLRGSDARQYSANPLLLERQVEDEELSVEELKERKIMKLLLKVKNGTPPQRKAALRQLTDKARDFGAGPLFNQILPLLMSPTLEDQERHLLVKVRLHPSLFFCCARQACLLSCWCALVQPRP